MKRIIALLVIFVIAVSAGVCAFADSSDLDYITDSYGLLTKAELQKLENQAANIAERYSCGIYVVIVDNYKNYSSRSDAYSAANDIYERYHLGYGDTTNGVFLLLSVEERDYALTFNGTARAVFSDSSFYNAEQKMLSYLKNDDWKGGINCFITGCSDLLTASSGLPESYKEPVQAAPFLIIVGVSAVIATCVCFAFASQMKTAKESTTADNYIKTSSIAFTVKEDRFTHRTVSRTKISTNNGSRSGGGGGGGGHSGHSGKF